VLAGVDCVAILTDHSSIDYASIAAAAPLVVDSRNAIKSRHPHVFRLGAPTVGGPAVTAGLRSGEEAA
jgi:UDP-N-acetyl-D-mannosaminuronate dehydrogenase